MAHNDVFGCLTRVNIDGQHGWSSRKLGYGFCLELRWLRRVVIMIAILVSLAETEVSDEGRAACVTYTFYPQ